MIFQNCHKFHSRNGAWNYVKQLWNIMITRGIYAKYPLYKSCHYQYLCLSNHRDYNGGKYPLRISFLDRSESNLGKTSRWSKSLKIHENLPDVTVDIIVGGELSINTTRNFLKSGTEPFNCEEEGKTLLSVILWDWGIICLILKLGRLKMFGKLTSNLINIT